MHPIFATQARQFPPTALTTEHEVCEIALYYYRRFISEDVTELRGEMSDWFVGAYTSLPLADFKGSIMKYWTYLQRNKPNNKLPTLALTIRSIAVNTATCERLFSELGRIHSPRRNQTRAEKTLKQQIVRQHVREQNRQERPARAIAKELENATAPLDPTELSSVRSPERRNRAITMEAPVRPTPENNHRELTPSRHHAADRTHSFPVTQTLAGGILTTPHRRVNGPATAATPQNLDHPDSQAHTASNAGRLADCRFNTPHRRVTSQAMASMPRNNPLSLVKELDVILLPDAPRCQREMVKYKKVDRYLHEKLSHLQGVQITVELAICPFFSRRQPHPQQRLYIET